MGLESTENPTVPFPVPLAPDVIWMKDELLTAFHWHEAWAVTLIEPVPPPTAKFCEDGLIETEQVGVPGPSSVARILPPGP